MTKQWSKHKALLHQLYISEKRKLKKVMEHMEKEHSFVACRRAYMKTFSGWGYQKNRKSRVHREGGSSGKVNRRQAELNTWEADAYAPTHKINDAGITHLTDVLIQEGTTPEVTSEPAVSHQTTGGIPSLLDEFKDSNDLEQYMRFIQGVLLLDEIEKKALVAGNPDPHFPAVSDYRQTLGELLSDRDL